MFYNGLNLNYFLFMIPAFLITFYAQIKMKTTYSKYSSVAMASGMTGVQVARKILDANGLHNVGVEMVGGQLSDHYDPSGNVVRLSEGVYASTSVAAAGIAAHECGHAVQYATGYMPIKIRAGLVPICNLASKLSIPLILIGFFMDFFSLTYVGIAFFAVAVLFQLATLPVEFNASKRAIETLDNGFGLSVQEVSGVSKVLTAAALTYVASLLQSLLQLLYFVSIAGRRNRR